MFKIQYLGFLPVIFFVIFTKGLIFGNVASTDEVSAYLAGAFLMALLIGGLFWALS